MAKRFKFNLEVVRQVRRRAEEAQQRVVAGKVAEVLALDRQLEALREAETVHCREMLARRSAGPIDMEGLRRVQVYLGSLRKAIAHRTTQRREASEALNLERGRLVELSARRKVLDKLREKRLAAHRAGVRKEEQAAMDEIGLQQYVRGGSPTSRRSQVA